MQRLFCNVSCKTAIYRNFEVEFNFMKIIAWENLKLYATNFSLGFFLKTMTIFEVFFHVGLEFCYFLCVSWVKDEIPHARK